MKTTLKNVFKNNIQSFATFGICFAVLISILIYKSAAPFGNYTIMVGDGYLQYLPFLSELRSKLLNNESLLFSWNMGMGMNFYAVFAYYLASPFNFILLLVDKDNLIACVHIIWMLKLCLAGFTMAYYLNKRKGSLKSQWIVMLSVMYVLNNFAFGFGHNIMWLDVIMIFPLIMLGFERLMEGSGKKLYIFTLAFAMYCNYYLSFIMCIFLALYFLTQSFESIKDFGKKILRFGLSSILAAGMSAFLLIPTFLQLQTTTTSGRAMPEAGTYANMIDVLRQQFFGTMPVSVNLDFYANFYCGVIVIPLVFGYMFLKNVSIKTRVKKIILLMFMFFACNEELLNYVWHGFHEQIGVPNRFVFMMIFLMLLMGAQVLEVLEEMDKKEVIIAGILAIGYVMVCFFLSDGRHIPIEKVPFVVTIVLVLLYVIMMLAQNIRKKGLISFVIPLIVMVELIVHTFLVYTKWYVPNGEEYFPKDSLVYDAKDEIETMLAEEDDGFYRTEILDSKSTDEITWYNLRGVSCFSSTIVGDLREFMKDMGHQICSVGYFYKGATPFTDALLNVRYIISQNTDYEGHYFECIEDMGNVKLYENMYPLSVGFAVSKNILEWEDYYGIYYENYNNLAELMTGYSGLMRGMDIEYECISKKTVTEEEFYEFGLKYIQNEYTLSEGSFVIEEPGDYYFVFYDANAVKIKYRDVELSGDYSGQLVHMKDMKPNDKVWISYVSKVGEEERFSIAANVFDKEVFEKVYAVLDDNLLQVTDYDDGYIKGDIYIPEGQLMFTSVPNEAGWEVYVDGEKTDITPFAGAFICVEMEPGYHTVEMKFTVPGLLIGIVISAISFAVMGIMMYLDVRRKREYLDGEGFEQKN